MLGQDPLVRSRQRLASARALIHWQQGVVAASIGIADTHRQAMRVLLALEDSLFELEEAHRLLAILALDDRVQGRLNHHSTKSGQSSI